MRHCSKHYRDGYENIVSGPVKKVPWRHGVIFNSLAEHKEKGVEYRCTEGVVVVKAEAAREKILKLARVVLLFEQDEGWMDEVCDISETFASK